MRHSPPSRPRPRPPARQERKGIASRVLDANPRATLDDAHRVARAINRRDRERNR